MRKPPRRANKPQITQQSLEDYLTLQIQFRALKQQFDAERDRLMGLVKGGAAVEPGALDIQIKETQQKRVGKDYLIGRFGSRRFEEMRQESPTIFQHKLVILERDAESPTAPSRGGPAELDPESPTPRKYRDILREMMGDAYRDHD